MSVREAKHRIGDVWRLAHLRGWPLASGVTSACAWWRGDSNPSLGISEDGQVWIDRATRDSGDMVTMLEKAERLTNREACALIVRIAEGIAEAPPPVTFPPRATPEDKRSRWPQFGALTDEEVFDLAARRRFPHFAGVRAASDRGLLVSLNWFETGSPFPVDAWGVTDASRNAARVRRMDGKPWRVRDSACKSKSLPGSVAGWPVGIAEAGERTAIVLTEGEPDLLAAMTLHCMLSPTPATGLPRDPGTFAFCCLSASTPIAADALPLFKGKSVRIVPHADNAGKGAVSTWAWQLHDAGVARVKIFNLSGLQKDDGKPAKDLNDVTTTRGFTTYRGQLAELFST